MEIEVEGQTIQLSEAGWMEDLSEWTEAIAVKIATDVEGVEYIIASKSLMSYDCLGSVLSIFPLL